ncbi:hypothetical protein HQ496_05900 [bacterium]|nr:hypothetical protein [bacterium]
MKKTLFSLLLAIVLSACTSSDSPQSAILEFPDRPDAGHAANGDFSWPGSWEYRLDNPSEDYVISGDTLTTNPDVYFTNMTPGWHVTMKSPAGIFWHPASTTAGDFSASATIFLFDPGQLNEGYGIFVGGADLDKADQQYIYFLLRRSGEFLIKRRMGSETMPVLDWTTNDAIAAWTESSEINIENKLGIERAGETVSFLVNDVVVHSMPQSDLQLDGIVGFRLNHGTNVHISAFDVVETPSPTM